MKRILIFILALCLLVPCFGCNKAEAPEVAPSAEPTEKMNEELLMRIRLLLHGKHIHIL